MSTSRLRLAFVIAVVLGFGVAAKGRWQVADSFIFAGSDSYGYVNLANELYQHGRYSLGPTQPLHYGRVPLYPLFIAAVKGDAKAEMMGGPGWGRIKWGQALADLLIALPLMLWMGWRHSRAAGVVALWLGALWPLTLMFVGAALTESLSATLTVLTIAPLVGLATRPETTTPQRRRLYWIWAGAGLALSTLIRPDGLMLGSAFIPALFTEPATTNVWRGRMRASLFALAGFLVIYGAWPVRNMIQFGAPHWLGTHTDRYAKPMDHYRGYWNWMRSWGRDSVCQTAPATCFFNPPCAVGVAGYEAGAFDSDEEKKQVAALFALRAKEGLSKAVDEGLQHVADQRMWHHPLRSFVWLPLSRAFHMWFATHDEILSVVIPKEPMIRLFRRAYGALAGILIVGCVAAFVFLRRRRETALLAMVLFVPIVVRTLTLSFFLYSMPRYAVEVMPIALVLVAIGGTAAVSALRRRRTT